MYRALLFAVALLLTATPAPGQLRPLDPFEWRTLQREGTAIEVGAAVLRNQRASLAGTEGLLVEAGSFRAFWRTGRAVFEAGGTLQRFFEDRRRVAPPEQNVTHPGADRRDAGDYRIASVVRLTPERAPAVAILRFGTRLPTTDNRVGLERDRIDFFALIGGRVERAGAALSAETGVSINGTRDPGYEQSDVWVQIVRAEYDFGALVPSVTLVGHMDGLPDASIRGNEDLGEVRLGIRAGERRWIRAELVTGFQAFSPDAGVIVAAGAAW